MAKSPPPARRENKEVRGREHLTEEEVDRLMKAARAVGRHGHRDSTMILIAYTHGLRVTELVRLRWDQIDLKAGTIYCKRLKGSLSGTHPLRRIETASLKKLGGDRRGLVFRSERGTAISDSGFRKIVARAAIDAKIGVEGVHPHMLRHGCGFKLTNEGHDTRAIQAWLGHKNIANTVKYTELAPDRFLKLKFWED
jgi:site-specific recombinase XerD